MNFVALALSAIPGFVSQRISYNSAGLRLLVICAAVTAIACGTITAYPQSVTATAVTASLAGRVATITATVSSGATAVTQGQVNFCDATAAHCSGAHLIETAQLTSHGTAVLRFRPAAGTHTWNAVFLGTKAFAASRSAGSPLTVAATTVSTSTTTTITKTGSWGNYSLTGSVTEAGNTAPLSGTVSFLDASYGNAALGSAPLGVSHPGWTLVNSQTFLTGTTPFSTVNADFNRDGILDLAVANARSNTVTTLLGNGDGTFSELSSIPFASEPYPLVTTDFNSDGIPDLGVVNYVQNTITLLLGKGNGTFTELPETLPIGGIIESLTVGDFNSDGIPDLITTSYFSATTIFLGNGDGTFKASQISATVAGWLQSLVSGDFNGDGKLDFAGLDGSILRIFLGDGDGTFTRSATTYNSVGDTSFYPGPLVASDFDNDGRPDLMVMGQPDSVIVCMAMEMEHSQPVRRYRHRTHTRFQLATSTATAI